MTAIIDSVTDLPECIHVEGTLVNTQVYVDGVPIGAHNNVNVPYLNKTFDWPARTESALQLSYMLLFIMFNSHAPAVRFYEEFYNDIIFMLPHESFAVNFKAREYFVDQVQGKMAKDMQHYIQKADSRMVDSVTSGVLGSHTIKLPTDESER
ncbi:MAG: hypothetical protein H6550_15965 [Chitinophagales bacterium]|nr:hypothetical protein [Chitinophagales bacterium]